MGRNPKRRYSPAGVPIDPNAWTGADWQDLHEGITAIQLKIAGRHRGENPDGDLASGIASGELADGENRHVGTEGPA